MGHFQRLCRAHELLAPPRDVPYLGIDELYLDRRYRCVLTNIKAKAVVDLLASHRQDVVTSPDEAERLAEGRDRQRAVGPVRLSYQTATVKIPYN